jgi:hypothetical protein
MDLTVCPDWGEVAEIQWRAVLGSTDGPIEHVKILCLLRHRFLLPVASLSSAPRNEAADQRTNPSSPLSHSPASTPLQR